MGKYYAKFQLDTCNYKHFLKQIRISLRLRNNKMEQNRNYEKNKKINKKHLFHFTKKKIFSY